MKRTPIQRNTPLVRLPRPRVGVQSPKPVAKKKAPPKVKRRAGGALVNPGYLEFIRTLPCLMRGDPRHICGGKTEAAHIGLSAGMGQKAPDETAVPMCGRLHRTEQFAHHRIPRTFFAHWGVDRFVLIRKYQAIAKEAGVKLWLGEKPAAPLAN